MSTTQTDSDPAPAGGTEDAEASREAGAQLSTAPGEDRLNVPSLGLLGWLRWTWRQLTSMRVALILLFLVSLGAVPGSVIPQTSVDAVKVEEFRQKHDVLAPIYDRLQLFDVYSSVWFSAIYILLFISLAGCIVPRSWQFVGQLRSRPPRAPRRLNRMPAYTTWRTDAAPEEVLGAARSLLGGKRFRTDRAEGADSVAAEKGYLREAGNLVFHIALIVLLLAFAAGQLWKAEGSKLVIKGDGFANTMTQYDDFRSGSLFSADDLDTFGFTLKDFHASFESSGPNKNTPRDYRADITYWEGADGAEKPARIEVNKPLQVGDSKVYLIAHGYAPIVSVKDGKGDIAYRGPVPFLQQDTNLTSSGVVKVTDYRDARGRKDQLGFQGFFVPHFDPKSGTMFSQSPMPKNPVMFLTAYRGDLGLDAGLAQSVYQLDTSNMKQFKEKNGRAFAKRLDPGGTMKLPNGAGTLKFEGIEEWANFTVSHQKGNGWALAGALAAIVGLAGSLFIQRRRVWVRAATGPDGQTVVEMAGLGRSDSARLPEELGELADELRRDAPVAAPPEPTTADSDSDAAGSGAGSGAGEPDTGSGSGSASDPEPGAEAGPTPPTAGDAEDGAATSPRGERQ
ncbi:cytochrome c biogenesis protein ResB [Streptomyces sp. AJS327]|uniref:cytochrome c biogenesis protein ResB n=1 Tax=Streptomyces sp. AJS327 TaxID=2545265 RepID=UPI0015DD8463|nr:cytochrome c biogenesis protein ResB [Streptomyces sp. AJS327]MBA0053881.1 cytochrome c biogenesis protein ResB [Streptomyces sp. AJS327]